MGVELATAYVSLSASAKGIGKSIQSELQGPLAAGGTKAGEQSAKNFGSSLRGGMKNLDAAGTEAGQRVAKGFGGSLKAGLSSLPISPAFLGGTAVIGAVKFAIDAASNLQESVSKTDAVFKQNADEVKQWAETARESFGQSKQQALEAASTFGNLFQAFGVGLQPATEMSTTLTQLASDLASFNNTSVEEAIIALRSGLSGETEPLKRYGVALTDARLKQEALGLGLIRDVKAPLDAAAKSQAAYALIMKDTALAQGDFERTADGYANTMRTLQATISDVAAELGTQLLPALSELAKIAADAIVITVEIQKGGEQVVKSLDEQFLGLGSSVLRAVNPIESLKALWADSQEVNLFGLVGDEAEAATTKVMALSREFASAHGGAAGYAAAMTQVNNANNQVADSVSMAREGVRTYGQTIRDANAALQEHMSLQLAAIDSSFAVTAAQNAFTTAVEAANVAVDDASTGVNEQQVAIDAATQSAVSAAGATLELARQQAGLQGKTLTAKEEQQNLIGTLMDLASRSSGPVASSIGAVITKLQDVGKQQPKPTLNVDDRATGILSSVKVKLAELGNTTASPVVRLVDEVTGRVRQIRESIETLAGTRLVFGVPGGLASGVRNWRGGWTWVGEDGPELVNLPKGADVYPAAQSAAMAGTMSAVSPAGAPVVITGNTFIGSGPEITKLLDARIREGRRAGVQFLGS